MGKQRLIQCRFLVFPSLLFHIVRFRESEIPIYRNGRLSPL
ncbi:hypothetical protein NMS_2219 [Nonlabens marinus S1-08]|uniref:Uncharacterized protein n=1 Tax=Nonlabens marinus S1-08 TaxID=1454201 RepID=W8VWD7_9FLAO|nr:hypothetical protein NMS_2219 [Nonlabens marinus S1-08]